MATRLSGYARIPGDSARRYRTPGGGVISYRQYRALLAAEGQIRPLQGEALRTAQRKRQAFKDIIDQISKVRTRQLESQLVIASGQNDEAQVHELEQQLRYVRSTAIKSLSRKQALKDLEKYGRRKKVVQGITIWNNAEAEQKTREALIVLGRREGIPDWVPVGESGKQRYLGGLQRVGNR